MAYDLATLQNYAVQAAQNNGIDPNIFLAQIQQESSFNPAAQNGNATGIAQFMPGTAAQFGIDPTDPLQSLNAAAQYDAQLLAQNGGDYTAMLTSYGTLSNNPGSNVGPGSSIYGSFQNLIAGLTGSSNANAATTSATDSGSSGSGIFDSIKNTIATWGQSALAIAIGIIILAAAIWSIAK